MKKVMVISILVLVMAASVFAEEQLTPQQMYHQERVRRVQAELNAAYWEGYSIKLEDMIKELQSKQTTTATKNK